MRYNEFGFFEDNAREAGLPWTGRPAVRREFVDVGAGQRVSALIWGDGAPRTVLLHGGAQNAHTWDTVALALNRPLIAIDLPGHGHSDWREDRDYWPVRNAEAIATVIERLAPEAEMVVGMSLGGLTAIRLAARHPALVRKLVVVDVTPGVNLEKAAPIAAFVDGPETFASLDELLERTIRFNPSRSVSSLRRGIMHNAGRREDGTWQWRYDRLRPPGDRLAFEGLWDDLAAVKVPTMLVRGSLSGVVSPDDVDQFSRRVPHARVETVEGAGHSVQGDRPVELARLLDAFA
ncbi:alpha/beta fold hydrolase [Actinomadura sp. LD22]|uniref:Alpha/beta fold hydrolase n=1 Tax=Actinomadura physcomitrii TaxID=2650748 RepID=A0A6I4M5S5_9ACTN|nr:alpha/beta hydrolase [Actinomadura physcomitrii]MWA00892.1 alpha/beta fold hydrolase [Actinomadura physcomitrii]